MMRNMMDKRIFKRDIGHNDTCMFDLRSASINGDYTVYLDEYSASYYLPPNAPLSIYLCFEI